MSMPSLEGMWLQEQMTIHFKVKGVYFQSHTDIYITYRVPLKCRVVTAIHNAV